MAYDYRLYKTPASVAYHFRNFQEAMNHGFSGYDYVSVYAGRIKAENVGAALEGLYEIHNMDNRPNGNCFSSLSVSDVVTINGIPYYCDTFGWSEIPRDKWR